MRLTVLAMTLLGLALVPARSSHADGADHGRPDVLLITIDTLRADHLGSYGFLHPVSPRMDELAASGVVFERAIAASSSTAPSHASIFTARYPRQHSIGYGNGGTRLTGDVTLAELFAKAGYSTAAFVSNIVLRRSSGLDRGFDVFDDELLQSERNRSGIYERIAEHTATRALAWLAEAGDSPIFLWVHLQDPHGPYTPPASFGERFQLPPLPGERKLRVLDSNDGWGGIPAYQAIPGLFLPAEYRARYAGEILYVDGYVGEIVNAIDARRPEREAVILITADHGESQGENDRWFVHYYTTTPSNAHVPMIIRAPGVKSARRSDLVSHVDVMPTLLDLAGVPVPTGIAGVALGPYLRNDAVPIPERFVFCDMGHELSAYRGNQFIRVMDLTGAWQPGNLDAERDEPLWFVRTWGVPRSTKPVPRQASLDPSIRDYVWETKPMVMNTDLDAVDRERLRALGYLDQTGVRGSGLPDPNARGGDGG